MVASVKQLAAKSDDCDFELPSGFRRLAENFMMTPAELLENFVWWSVANRLAVVERTVPGDFAMVDADGCEVVFSRRS
jgi:hypothetical protein